MTRLSILGLAASLTLAKLIAYALVAGRDPAGPLCQYDCRWYGDIARHGYAATIHVAGGHDQHAWPFFPVLPLMLAAVRYGSGLDVAHAATLVACLCTVALVDTGQLYRSRTRADARASTWLLMTITMPFGFYFATGYAEAPYALLAVSTLSGLARASPSRAALPCAILGATRPTGILLAPALGMLCVRRAAGRATVSGRIAALLPILAAMSGLLGWIGFCAVRTGDPLAFVHAQADWGRHLADPLEVVQSALRGAVKHHHGRGQGYEALWALGGLAVAAIVARRGRWAEALLLGGTILLALSSGSPGSMPRFVGASPVFLLFVADILDRIEHAWIRHTCFAASAAIQLTLLHFWIRGWHALI